jgi:hypothetical protein
MSGYDKLEELRRRAMETGDYTRFQDWKKKKGLAAVRKAATDLKERIDKDDRDGRGMRAVKECLRKFGAITCGDLDDRHYEQFIGECNAWGRDDYTAVAGIDPGEGSGLPQRTWTLTADELREAAIRVGVTVPEESTMGPNRKIEPQRWTIEPGCWAPAPFMKVRGGK